MKRFASRIRPLSVFLHLRGAQWAKRFSLDAFVKDAMFSLTVRGLAVLAALAMLPTACAQGGAGVTPQGSPAGRAIESGGTTSGGGGTTSGGGGTTSGGGGTTTCNPLPGTCVLNATIAVPIRFGTMTGQIRFERSPSRMAVTGTLAPGTTFSPNSYFAVLIDTPTGTIAPIGYAARGVTDPVTGIVAFEVLPGDGLFSQTPNSAPVDPNFNASLALGAGWSFVSDPTPPSPAVLALFQAVKSGSSVRIGTLAVQGQTCPCPAPGPVVPAILQYDIPPSSLR